jgi:hypothetical protein
LKGTKDIAAQIFQESPEEVIQQRGWAGFNTPSKTA